jgi:hypothetical protein
MVPISVVLAALLQASPPAVPKTPSTAGGIIMLYDRAGIERWAKCSWEKAPVSAANWLRAERGEKVAARPSSNPFADPQSTLALRLNHVCGDLLAPSDRRSSFAASAKVRILSSLKPAAISVRDDDMKVLVCEHRIGGQLLRTDLDPAAKPKSENGIKVRCFRALEDGSLINA